MWYQMCTHNHDEICFILIERIDIVHKIACYFKNGTFSAQFSMMKNLDINFYNVHADLNTKHCKDCKNSDASKTRI